MADATEDPKTRIGTVADATGDPKTHFGTVADVTADGANGKATLCYLLESISLHYLH